MLNALSLRPPERRIPVEGEVGWSLRLGPLRRPGRGRKPTLVGLMRVQSPTASLGVEGPKRLAWPAREAMRYADWIVEAVSRSESPAARAASPRMDNAEAQGWPVSAILQAAQNRPWFRLPSCKPATQAASLSGRLLIAGGERGG